MKNKKWVICGTCPYLDNCKAGQAKTSNITANSPVYNEIGCFDYEQVNPKQMKLL